MGRLQHGQVLALACALRWRTSAVGAGASARRLGELALGYLVLTSQRRQPVPAAGTGLAPAHIQVPPAACSFTPTALMCVTPSPAQMIPMQQCVQRRLRPKQLLATSCKAKSRIRLESTIENLSEPTLLLQFVLISTLHLRGSARPNQGVKFQSKWIMQRFNNLFKLRSSNGQKGVSGYFKIMFVTSLKKNCQWPELGCKKRKKEGCSSWSISVIHELN